MLSLLARSITPVAIVLAALALLTAPARAESADGEVRYQLSDSLENPYKLVLFQQDPPPTTAADSDTPMPMGTTPESTTLRSLRDRPTSRFARLSRRRWSQRLTRAPHMFGDWFAAAGTAFHDTGFINGSIVNTGIPLAAGSRRAKVSENNSALTKDRVWIGYNHFHNAVKFRRFNGNAVVGAGDADVDRFTVGIERTLCDGDWSVEVRMPFARRFDLNQSDINVDGGNYGDLAVFIKHVLHEWDEAVLSAGLGINTPTGSSIRTSLPLINTTYVLDNNALTLQPYLAFTGARDIWFYHGFLQVDVPTSGNEWRVNENGNLSNFVLTDQTLLQLDGGFGVWLTDNCCLPRVTGVAALLEWHYTTTLSDADGFLSPTDDVGLFANVNNRFDVVNMTAALHFELDPSCDVRIGLVTPLDETERFFDFEAAIQVNKHY